MTGSYTDSVLENNEMNIMFFIVFFPLTLFLWKGLGKTPLSLNIWAPPMWFGIFWWNIDRHQIFNRNTLVPWGLK